MTLAPKTRLGHYEIQSLPGAGGMGEVHKQSFQLRDTNQVSQVIIVIMEMRIEL